MEVPAPRTEPGFPGGRAPVSTGWEDEPERLSSRGCGTCHAESHADWEAGMHSQSWRDPVFEEAFVRDPVTWCVHCHAPLVAQRDIFLKKQRNPGEQALLDEGISCVACHVRGGVIYGSRALSGEAHAVVASQRLGQAEFCADCHQFNFLNTSEPVQDTYGEWLASGGETPCVECHWRGRHRMVGPHDGGWMDGVLGEPQWTIEGRWLRWRMPVAVAEHRFPTGDAFHSLELEVARDAAYEEGVGSVYWERELSDRGGKRIVGNTTALAGAEALEASLEVPAQGALYGRLRYHFADRLAAVGLPESVRARVLWTGRIR